MAQKVLKIDRITRVFFLPNILISMNALYGVNMPCL